MEIVSESENNMTIVNCIIPVPFEPITNCITGAIEGGSSHWCSTFQTADDDVSTRLYQSIRNAGEVWYDEAAFWEQGGKAVLTFDKPTDADSGTRTIGRDELVNGLAVMALVAPRHFGDLIQENDDAETHDVFLQCVLFGEIIFG